MQHAASFSPIQGAREIFKAESEADFQAVHDVIQIARLHVDEALPQVEVLEGHPADGDAAAAPRLGEGDDAESAAVEVAHGGQPVRGVVLQQAVDLVRHDVDAVPVGELDQAALRGRRGQRASRVVRLVHHDVARVGPNRRRDGLGVDLPAGVHREGEARELAARVQRGLLDGLVA